MEPNTCSYCRGKLLLQKEKSGITYLPITCLMIELTYRYHLVAYYCVCNTSLKCNTLHVNTLLKYSNVDNTVVFPVTRNYAKTAIPVRLLKSVVCLVLTYFIHKKSIEYIINQYTTFSRLKVFSTQTE